MKTSADKHQEMAVHRTEQCQERSSTHEGGQRADGDPVAPMPHEIPAEPVLRTPAAVHTWTRQGLGPAAPPLRKHTHYLCCQENLSRRLNHHVDSSLKFFLKKEEESQH